MAKILLVEDDADLGEEVRYCLQSEHHLVEMTANGTDAWLLLNSYPYDLVILDWDLPGMTGVDILHHLRAKNNLTPVLMLTGKSEVGEKERGLDSGADDYLTKPFISRELAARVRALLRRASGQKENLLKTGALVIDPSRFTVSFRNAEIHLQPKEFALLEFLLRHAGEVYGSEALLARIWSSESDASPNTVKSYMYTLRKKLAAHGLEDLIQTVHKVGYKLIPLTEQD